MFSRNASYIRRHISTSDSAKSNQRKEKKVRFDCCMTSASELFYSRRSRVSRTTTTADLGLDSSSDLHSRGDTNHYRRHHSRLDSIHNHNPRRNTLDGCDPVRRSTDVRHFCHRASQLERESIRLEQGSSQYDSGNNVNTETPSSITNRIGVTRNDRLPGAVLLARERLLQRLRGVSVSENRLSSRDTLRMHADPLDLDAEILMGWLSRGTSPSTDPTSQNNQPISSQKQSKPPGLTQHALDCLHSEVFCCLENSGVEVVASRSSGDCSICLESFEDGDKLIRLSCEHRFHSTCLDPWVRTCGDCPYCRRGIVVNSLNDAKRI